ncbi:MAG: hypothetical protein QXN16_03165, partial [Candidatus Micrarchaeaceae archaeon]
IMLLEKGRLCIKKYGRDAGSKAVITKVNNDNTVMIVTSKRNAKERKCNVNHLEFLSEIINVDDKEAVKKALGIV